MKNRDHVKKNWMLGPEKTQQPNSDYWRKIATVWRISPDQARRNLCANCEYFNDSPDMLAKMESIPEDAYDKDGGGRGFCQKFKFVCHTLRTCQAWERGEQPQDEGEDYSNGDEE
ncbi:high potential iron-sulfur protein [Caudoviricetes sp.]|nr:high potential iron-sulfur protein [Caudoviricetes sp.]